MHEGTEAQLSADLNEISGSLNRIAGVLEETMPSISESLIALRPGLLFVADNGNLVIVPEVLRKSAHQVQTTPITQSLNTAAQALNNASRRDPAVKMIADRLEELVNLLTMGMRPPEADVPVPDLDLPGSPPPVQGAAQLARQHSVHPTGSVSGEGEARTDGDGVTADEVDATT